MNMKEAFRFQNKLDAILSEAEDILKIDRNVMKQQSHYLHSKVISELKDEIIEDRPDVDLGENNVTNLIQFTVFILQEKEKLFRAIRKAKNEQAVDIDSEVSLNSSRQQVAAVLRRLAGLRDKETIISNGGFGYRFNAEGNQVSYKCDVKRISSINFDRGAVQKLVKELNAKADAVSADIDRCVVNATVDYTVPFDVNASFMDIFEDWLPKKTA